MDTVIIVSPKLAKIHPKIAANAHGFKYVISAGEVDPEDGLPLTNTQELGGTPVRLARPPVGSAVPIYLSPLDNGGDMQSVGNTLNRKAVAMIALKFGYRAGLQLHKFMGQD